MKTVNSCKRIVLAGNDGCRVWFCQECNVAEIEVGSLSLRLEAEAFSSLSELLMEASSRIAALSAVKKSQEDFGGRVGNLH
ncbi:MAG TPA: hypothetical protein VK974_05120 [Methylophilaceae bacterium]|nr:hypothetical protein [Methylophilaceae bacterium]